MSRFADSRALRALTMVAGMVGLSFPVAARTDAPTPPVSPQAAPQTWIDFADTANASVTAWVSEESETAVRLRAYLDAQRAGAAEPAEPGVEVVLRLWTDPQGTVSRVEFPPFAHEQASADLRALLVGRGVGAVPPRDILFPLRLAVRLDPAPEGAGE